MNPKSLHSFAAALFLTVLGAASARAGSIYIVNLPPTNTDMATGITTNKTYVGAWTFGNLGSFPSSINSVDFTHLPLSGGNNLFYVTNAVYTQGTSAGQQYVGNYGQVVLWTSNVLGDAVLGVAPVYLGPTQDGSGNPIHLAQTSSTTTGSPANQADGNTRAMIEGLIYTGNSAPVVNGIGSWMLQEYDGLTIGHSYSLCIYYSCWSSSAPGRLIDTEFNGEGSWQAYTNNPWNEDLGTNGTTVSHNPVTCKGARYMEYDFTAAATNVYCLETNIEGNGAFMLRGATLQDDTYPYAPFITYQSSVAGIGNGQYQFGVDAIGSAPVTYQWYTNSIKSYSGAGPTTDAGSYIGSTSNILTTTAQAPTNSLLQYYFVVIGNNQGYATSSIVQISIAASIATQPAPTNEANAYVAFGMTAGGFLPLSYQWYSNSVSSYSGATAVVNGGGVSGANTNILDTSVNLNQYYFVIVTNPYGSATSSITSFNPLPGVTNVSSFRTGNNVGFKVTAGGWPTLNYQWYVNTVSNISGATAMTDGGGVSGSQTASVSVNNPSAYYFVVVTNIYGAATSQVAVLDSSQLTVIGAGIPIWNPANNQTNVCVYFSDFVDPVTATEAGNYTLSGGTVSSASVVGSNEVLLTTSPLTGSQTLMVSGVEDYYEIPMTPTPTNLTVGLYPANLALWVRANAANTVPDGQNYGGNSIFEWYDLSGNGNNLYGYDYDAPATPPVPYDPILATNAWGDPVVRFNAALPDQMFASSDASLAIASQNSAALSILAVMNFATFAGGTNAEIVSKTGNTATSGLNIPSPYDCYVGSGDEALYRGNGGSSGDGVSYGQFTAPTGPSAGVPHILVVTEYGNAVRDYVDGNLVGSGILNGGFPVANIVDNGNPLFIGERADGVDCLTGDMAELMIANSALSTYDITQLTTYLAQVHNLALPNTSPMNLLFSVTANQLTLSWPTNQTGWVLQAQTNSVSAGISTNWGTVNGSTSTNMMVMPINPANGCVFYRLIYAP